MPNRATPNQRELRAALHAMRQEHAGARSPKEGRQAIASAIELFQILGIEFRKDAFDLYRALSKSAKSFADFMAKNPQCAELSMLELTEAASFSNDLSEALERAPQSYSPLQWCAHGDLWREARLLMTLGANPRRFNAGVTAIGIAAYRGSARTLAEMRAFGADMRLELLPEHTSIPATAGSTLLHRIANRQLPSAALKRACARILAECERCYPDLFCADSIGRTPLDWSDPSFDDGFSEVILSIAAEREARDLRESTAELPRRRRLNNRI